jgi:hypothetical protein
MAKREINSETGEKVKLTVPLEFSLRMSVLAKEKPRNRPFAPW